MGDMAPGWFSTGVLLPAEPKGNYTEHEAQPLCRSRA